jgi:hypothetical protein
MPVNLPSTLRPAGAGISLYAQTCLDANAEMFATSFNSLPDRLTNYPDKRKSNHEQA